VRSIVTNGMNVGSVTVSQATPEASTYSHQRAKEVAYDRIVFGEASRPMRMNSRNSSTGSTGR
jgi:hypothetical protein